MKPRQRRIAQMAGDAILWVVAVAGALSICLAIASFFWGYGVILFRTGSMTPTIPAGSAALVHKIPASEIRLGDVVTVDRPGTLPVTHRVVKIQTPQSASGGVRVVELRGDANAFNDPSPYTVTSVRKVVFSVPGIAPFIAQFQRPLWRMAVAVAVAALMLWALWPRKRAAQQHGGGVEDGGGDDNARSGPDVAGAETHPNRHDAIDGDVRTPESAGSGHGRLPPHHARAVGVGISARVNAGKAMAALVCALLATFCVAAPANAAVQGERIIQGQYLRLVSRTSSTANMLVPGTPAYWYVGISSSQHGAAFRSELVSDASPLLLDVTVDACSVEWAGNTCALNPRHVTTTTLASGRSDVVNLLKQQGWQTCWLRIGVLLSGGGAQSTSAAAVALQSRQLAVRVTQSQETISTVNQTGELPKTGVDMLPLGIVASAGLVGIVMIAVRRRREREEDKELQR